MDQKFRYHSQEELLEAIREKAASYVPEWHPDREEPDIGLALAQVFAKMQSETERKYGQLPEKFRTDLFNCLNTSMKTSAPARGYAVFGIADSEAEGIGLPAGTGLRTDVVDEYGERIPVETEEDVFVSPDTLTTVCECSEEKDYIGIYGVQKEQQEEIPLFCQKAENLQEHVFYLGHPFLLAVKSHGRITLSFYERRGVAVNRELLKTLAGREAACFFYRAEDAEIPFERVAVEGSGIVLEKTESMPPWNKEEMGGQEAFWLGCRILDKKALECFSFEEAYLSSECAKMAPELIYGDGAERREGPFLAFGERPSVFGEACFASEEALNKKGAMVELTFEQEFAKIPIDAPVKQEPVAWKLVMPKEDLRQEKEYEITIEEVVWEYYNGQGWACLPVDPICSRMFHTDEGRYRQLKRLEFVCPMDMEPVLVGAWESYYIRARIAKVNHAFKTNGYYMAPVLSGVSFRYRYPKNAFSPVWFFTKNNREEEMKKASACMGTMKPFMPVRGMEEQEDSLYLGFEKRPEKGPVRMLFVMEHDFERKRPQLSWEYHKDGKWKELHLADETESLSRTGIVTFQGIPDATIKRVGGQSLYWIRLRDRDRAYQKREIKRPVIRQIWMNAVPVLTVKRGIWETFTMESYQNRVSFRLLNRNIHTLEVWVKENGRISDREKERLKETGRLKLVRDESGILTETWVRWEETDSFLYHGPNDRCYLLDSNEGILTFGGGLYGAIPAPQVLGGIRVYYSIGGGENCNLLPGQVNGLELSAGFINTVNNPLALSGGYGRETAKEAMERAGREISHRFRAVAARDYISLAREASRNIQKAACFSGLNYDGERQPGAVVLVILKKDYLSGGSFFGDMKKELRNYLKDKLPVGMASPGRLFIREPLFVEIESMVVAQVGDFQDIFKVQRQISETLSRFLDPVTGNFDHKGWEIGTLPDRLQLETAIKRIPGVVALKRFVVFAFLKGEPGRPKADLEELSPHPYVLPLSGKHKIQIQVSESV